MKTTTTAGRRSRAVPILKALAALLAISMSMGLLVPGARAAESGDKANDLIMIGWNNLGIHCINPRYADLAILPPYNNLLVQVIRRGNPPAVVTGGITLEYSIINNTTVAGKTDFWTWVQDLFGVNPPPGMGLAGFGLSGTMRAAGDHFEALGIPVLPFNDRMVWNPYQLAVVKMLDSATGEELKKIQVVLPVSDEIHCEKCHADGADASANYGIATGVLEQNILTIHDMISGTALMDARPVLCAGCHADNALGTPGNGAKRSMSEAMHTKHSILLDLGYMDLPGCYDCHPGWNSRCLRTGIGGMGFSGDVPNCPDCHGDLAQVGASIAAGRRPWLDEPQCEKCHGINYGTGGALFRESAGHGGVRCPACHNSPHAWWPSKLAVDDLQPQRLQGKQVSLTACNICHTVPKVGFNPHTNYLMPLPVR